jgi:hypothetical protein
VAPDAGEHRVPVARLPWISHCDFLQEFIFRGNYGSLVPKTTEEESAKRHTFMLYSCRFSARVDITFSRVAFKLAFYCCSFGTGCNTDLFFAFPRMAGGKHSCDKEVLDRHGRGAQRQEIRMVFCDLGGTIVVREAPWPMSQTDFGSTAFSSGAAPAVVAPPYEQSRGIGLTLTGSTLRGVIDLKAIRLAWINCTLINVLGGALFVHAEALYSRRPPLMIPRFLVPIFRALPWFKRETLTYKEAPTVPEWLSILAGRVSRVFRNSAEQISLVHQEVIGRSVSVPERAIESDSELTESPRFSKYFRMSKRYIELSTPTSLAIEELRSTVQQYEDLRKAFSNATNSHSQEDFCHYKRMMLHGDADRLQGQRDRRNQIAIVIGSLWLGALFVVIAGLLIWGFDWAFVLESTPYMVAFVLVAAAILSENSRKAINGILDRYVFRAFLAYLVYPYRVIASMSLAVLGFALVYAIIDTGAYVLNQQRYVTIRSSDPLQHVPLDLELTGLLDEAKEGEHLGH